MKQYNKFDFTAEDIFIQKYTHGKRIITVIFVVLQPRYVDRFLKASTVKQCIDSKLGKSIGLPFGITVSETVTMNAKQRKKHNSSGMVAPIVAVFIALAIVSTFFFVYYRKK